MKTRIICAYCGVTFEREAKRKNATYCSRACTYQAARVNFNAAKFKQFPVKR